MLVFKGIQKTTLVDYPGEVACTLFVGGCNFRCFYCHNPELALDGETGVCLSEEEVLAFLRRRKGFIDAVCISGGEPLMQPDLVEFINKVKMMGYKVKIDTNGSYPEVLKSLLENKLIDYVAMDIKAPLSRYGEVVGCRIDQEKIKASAELIRQSGIDYEFRTTVSPQLKLEDFSRIGRWLVGSKKYCLQQMKTNRPLLGGSDSLSGNMPDLDKISHQVTSFFNQVEIRQ